MKKLIKIYNVYKNKIKFRLFLIYKTIRSFLKISKITQKKILFIIGCQRSGTSIMETVFKKDINTKVYEDNSRLSSQDKVDRIRLNPLNDVKKVFAKDHASLIVLKPLVETQHANKLLEYFDNSKALWMYRDYKDTAYSNTSHFGLLNGIRNLSAIVNNKSNNWRSENITPEIKKLVLKYFSKKMNPYDAAALFWYVRNNYFFQLELDKNPLVIMCKYVDFVRQPKEIMVRIYKFIGIPFPGENIVNDVHSQAIGKGQNLKLTPQIDKLCLQLQIKLDEIYKRMLI